MRRRFAEGDLFAKHSKVAHYPSPLILTHASTEFCCAFLDVDTTCLTQFVFAYGKLVSSLFGRVTCIVVCGGESCNVVVEFHVHMKLVMLIKICVNESCNKFPVRNGLNQRIKVIVWPMAIAFVQKVPLGMSKQTRRG